MPFASKNDWIAGRKPTVTQADTQIAAPRFTQTCVAADSALNNVGVIGILPAGFVPVMALVDSTGLGGTGAISLGALNAAGTDISTDAADGGAAWGSAVAVGTAGQVQVLSAALSKVKPSAVDRQIAVKFTTAGGTAGELGVTLFYRPAP